MTRLPLSLLLLLLLLLMLLHPLLLHVSALCVPAIGTVNFTGDMPVILMVDGPSLGGFVCPATIVSTELWKIGQVSILS